MAENQMIKMTLVNGLGVAEKVLRFMTLLVRATRKGLVDEQDHETHEDFKQIYETLETISEKNKKELQQIRINEINQNYGKYEGLLEHQYKAFNIMVENMKLDPENRDCHKQEFVKIYQDDKMDQSLTVFYSGVMGTAAFSPKSILDVYLEDCKRNKKVMEARCTHLAHLFSIGYTMLIVYYFVTDDDVDKKKNDWGQRFIEIEAKMQEALDQCTEEN